MFTIWIEDNRDGRIDVVYGVTNYIILPVMNIGTNNYLSMSHYAAKTIPQVLTTRTETYLTTKATNLYN